MWVMMHHVHAKQSYLNRDYSILEQKRRCMPLYHILSWFSIVWFYHNVWFWHVFGEFWVWHKLHWLKTPGLIKLMPSRPNGPFFNEHHFEIWFPKRKQLRFSEVKCVNYTKKTQFCMWQLPFSVKQGETRRGSGPIPSLWTKRWAAFGHTIWGCYYINFGGKLIYTARLWARILRASEAIWAAILAQMPQNFSHMYLHMSSNRYVSRFYEQSSRLHGSNPWLS